MITQEFVTKTVIKFSNMNRETLNAYADYLIGKPCPVHPNNKIKQGRWDIFCGMRDKYGTWCNGGSPTQEFISNYERENNE